MKKAIAAAAAVAVTLLTLVGCSTASAEKPAPSKTTKLPKKSAPKKEGGNEVVDFGQAVEHNGVRVSIKPVKRAVSGEFDQPAGKGYVELAMSVRNGAKQQIDASQLTIVCTINEGQDQAEEVFGASKLGNYDARILLPGQTAELTRGCVVPKGEQDLQVSAQGGEGTAMWKGTVK
ncbi:MAG TPA: hypothetical protein VNS49_22830 [Streptomyces sp.]|nr:hypothetical protein [Streptomyces sp.]